MYWLTVREQKPDDNQQVLLMLNGEIYVAWYRMAANAFELRDGTSISGDDGLKWTEILRPESDLGR